MSKRIPMILLISLWALAAAQFMRFRPPTNPQPIPQDYKLESVHELVFSKKVVIPAKAGIQSFQGCLDAGSSPA